MTENKNTVKKRSIFSVASVSAPILTVLLLVLVSASGRIINSSSGSNDLFLVISIVNIIIFIIPAAIYYMLSGRKLHSQIFLSPIRMKYILFFIFTALMFFCGSLLFKYFYYEVFGTPISASEYISEESLENADKLPVIISLCIVPAICEEIFFRGVILSEYLHYGTFNAIIISSMAFSMIHFSFTEFIPFFFSGVILGFLTVICRSVFPAMILHALNNYINIFGSSSFLRIIASQSGSFFVLFILTVLFVLSLIIVLSRLEHVYNIYSEKPPVSEIPPRSIDHLFPVYCSPTFYVLLIVFVVLTLL